MRSPAERHGDLFGSALPTPFIHGDALQDIKKVIDVEDCHAVIIRFDTGLGASTMIQRLAQEESTTRPVLTIHGTPSLCSVPYGALAPVMNSSLKGGDVGLRTSVLRGVLAALAKARSGDESKSGTPLLLVDDAHAVDPSTAELLLTLVLSGTVKLIATHLRNQALPDPLEHLWRTGNAESIELFPLTRTEGEKYCRDLLQAPVSLSVSRHFWAHSDGNPMLLRMLLTEALQDGVLYQDRGVWSYKGSQHTFGPDLRRMIGRQIRGLSAGAKEALDIVALAEPVSLPVVEQFTDKQAVAELIASRLVVRPFSEDRLLRLASPIYGEVIRQMVPPAQRRILYDNLLENLHAEPEVAEALVRRVSWAVDVGLPVSTDQLVNAALTACKLSQPDSSLELLAHIPEAETSIRTRAIKARAHYLLGNSDKAGALLDGGVDEQTSLNELLFAALLRATTKMALGAPSTILEADIEKFVLAGEHLAEQLPDQAAEILENIRQKEKVLRLLVFSRTGDYTGMSALVESILAGSPLVSEQEQRLNSAFALTMDAERLCAIGQAKRSHERAAEALAIEQPELNNVFFIPETIIFRQLATALCTGDLPLVARMLEMFVVNTGAVSVTFGAWPDVARGMGLLRQGLMEEALDVLIPSVDLLRVSDPQHLLSFCISMTAYAAARLGRNDLASQLISEYQEQPAMFLVVAHARIFLASAKEYVNRDGAALESLVAMAEQFKSTAVPLLELNALAGAAELGERSLVDRMMDVASSIEGPWSEAMRQFSLDVEGSRSDVAGTRASLQTPRAAPNVSQLSWFAAPVFTPGHSAPASRIVLPAGSVPPSSPAASDLLHAAPVNLTPRELEIATLAVQGISDRAIATKLSLSTRTVEGHLYRAYAKLGIAGRDDLTAELFP